MGHKGKKREKVQTLCHTMTSSSQGCSTNVETEREGRTTTMEEKEQPKERNKGETPKKEQTSKPQTWG